MITNIHSLATSKEIVWSADVGEANASNTPLARVGVVPHAQRWPSTASHVLAMWSLVNWVWYGPGN
jgi:hypothetical protein